MEGWGALSFASSLKLLVAGSADHRCQLHAKNRVGKLLHTTSEGFLQAGECSLNILDKRGNTPLPSPLYAQFNSLMLIRDVSLSPRIGK